MRFLVVLAAFWCVCAPGYRQAPGPGEGLKRLVPAFTAYIEPDPQAMEVSGHDGVLGWKDARQELAWYGRIEVAGTLHLYVGISLPAGETSQLRLTVAHHSLSAEAKGQGDVPVMLYFGSVDIPTSGYYRFGLRGVSKTGATFGKIAALALSGGEIIHSAHFNLEERRNAASVHLGYPLPADVKAEWFYNEVTVETDPLWSYYMACGFHRGYFGIQVNSPTERRIIFSVWDSGTEANDRNKVSAEDRVQLIAKGKEVVASDFGNEGTGGHSHLIYPWKKGETYRFLVHAQPDGTHTLYSAYFYFPERHQWDLIACFRAPKDGDYLHGLYSFNEDFEGANGQLRRLAEFGNQWIRTAEGNWQELTTARFTHDPTGKENRKDYDAGLREGRFFLSNGGFIAGKVHYGDLLYRPATGNVPAGLEQQIHDLK